MSFGCNNSEFCSVAAQFEKVVGHPGFDFQEGFIREVYQREGM